MYGSSERVLYPMLGVGAFFKTIDSCAERVPIPSLILIVNVLPGQRRKCNRQSIVLQPFFKFSLKSNYHRLWHGIRRTKGDQHRGTRLEPMRQVTLGNLDVGVSVERPR